MGKLPIHENLHVFIHIFMQIFMSFIKCNQSNRYVKLYTAKFNLFKMVVQYQFFPILMVQMLFSPNQQAQGPDFRMVGKSLNLSFYHCILHISSFSQMHLFSNFRISTLTHCLLGNFACFFVI